MGSGAMMYILSFLETGSGIRKLIGRDTQTQRKNGDLISLLLLGYFPHFGKK
jgi:hypothetical protein